MLVNLCVSCSAAIAVSQFIYVWYSSQIEELARDSSRAKLSVRGAIDASWHATGIEGSPQSTGDVISGSPPQSSGSGPTYYQMNYNDNIRR